METRHIRILLVESEEADRLAMNGYVAEKGLPYALTAAASLLQARALLEEGALLREDRYDLAISDCLMSDGTVFDLIPRLGETPFIILTGTSSETAAVAALKSGASDYLVKDQDRKYLESLPATLEAVLRGKAAERDRLQASEQRDRLVRELDAANRDLRDFTNVIAHEMKAPLRSIHTLAKWLEADYADKLDDAGREKFRLLQECVKRMHEFVEGFLEYSNVGPGQGKPDEIDLAGLVREVESILPIPARFRIRVDGPVLRMVGDRISLKLIFQNLISNALNWMDKPEGLVVIRCAEEEGAWRFSVEDNGPGIEPRDLERIFMPFQTLSRRDRARGGAGPAKHGTGMGLTIVRKLLQTYGGRIWAESEPDRGSSFHFTFPKNPLLPPGARIL